MSLKFSRSTFLQHRILVDRGIFRFCKVLKCLVGYPKERELPEKVRKTHRNKCIGSDEKKEEDTLLTQVRTDITYDLREMFRKERKKVSKLDFVAVGKKKSRKEEDVERAQIVYMKRIAGQKCATEILKLHRFSFILWSVIFILSSKHFRTRNSRDEKQIE